MGDLIESIGNTSLCRFSFDKKNNFYTKLEGENPTGSIKDRLAYHLIVSAIRSGQLNKQQKIIEVSTGNTGIALAYIAQQLGYKTEIILPDNVGITIIDKIKKFGGEIIILPISVGLKYAFDLAKGKSQDSGYFWPNQYSNKEAIDSYVSLADEVAKNLKEEKIDYLIAAVGTGGTIMGVGKRLLEYYPKMKIIAVEPIIGETLNGMRNTSQYYFGKEDIYQKDFPFATISVKKREVEIQKNSLANFGIVAGDSSGAVLYAALKIIEQEVDKNLLLLFADGEFKNE